MFARARTRPRTKGSWFPSGFSIRAAVPPSRQQMEMTAASLASRILHALGEQICSCTLNRHAETEADAQLTADHRSVPQQVLQPCTPRATRTCMHVCGAMQVSGRHLTWGARPLSGNRSAVFGTEAPSLKQSLERTVVPGWGDTAEPSGTAQGVHATGLSLGQHQSAAGSIMVSGGPTCPQRIPAGGTDLEGAQAVCRGPGSAVSHQQQKHSGNVGEQRHPESTPSAAVSQTCVFPLCLRRLSLRLVPLNVSTPL